jgi:hypothetical protein
LVGGAVFDDAETPVERSPRDKPSRHNTTPRRDSPAFFQMSMFSGPNKTALID